MTEKIYETYSPEETHALGKRLGAEAKPGDVLYDWVGDLGASRKTVPFTQGIAEGLGNHGKPSLRAKKKPEPVQSVQVYEEGRMPFFLSFPMFTSQSGTSEGDGWRSGYEGLFTTGMVCGMIEWANLRIDEILPASAAPRELL